ncbi:hypothetical protein JG687_00010510 [Phytophthora cactorum]|uniref:Elicitin n=1 Tax=Phytophthora cactorum TaxID=29920 RepID=A0A329RPQ4_9STRA|nr:hypothetical protein Pcac1_g8593 [Phytophthora cactorum]KAG2813196.1 hypothetical protein PC112_g14843 [Phytophthora cactorum]KAG2849329.1 hypothetical protein PC111_g15 [Phytophthora cactorum]KAG2869465.1 hypothetical protein PC113_g238 [Phytophthora cactorum]KAG2906852.1 hypothetical protein PC115_g14143 [Phytophthora cactorum]
MSVFYSVLRVLLAVLLVSCTSAQGTQNATFELAPIASAAPQSATFVVVDDRSCDASVVTIVYELYAKNTMVFQTCVSEGHYKIFPFSGTHPTPQQIGAMSRSLACRAIFTSIILGGIPECELSNFPIRAAAETLLKIGVDIDTYPNSNNVVPSTGRFIEMMHWRRDVNLARAAGLPCDSASKLFAEYTSNLYTITTNGLVRLTADKEVQYRSTTDGSFSQEQIVTMPNMPGQRGSGSGSKIIAVYAVETAVRPSSASSTTSDGVVTHAELKANTKENSDAPETEKTSTSDAASTSAGTQINWSQPLMATVVVAMLVFV